MRKLVNVVARAVERNPHQRVAESDLRSWTFVAAIQIGTTICVPLFALGGQLGSHQRFLDLIPAVLFGASIVFALASLTGYVGMKARVPTAILVRQTFGDMGAKLVAAILIFTLFGWFGIQTEVLAHSVQALLQPELGITLNSTMMTVLAGILMSSTAIIGFRALGKLAYVAVPLLLCVIAVPSWIAVTTHDVGPIMRAPSTDVPYSFGLVVSIVSGGYMVAVAIAPDVTRFLSSSRDNLIGMFVSFGIAYPVLLLLSSMLAVIYGSGDLIAIMISAGVGLPALAVIILATWTSNDKNLYESALSLSALFPQVERWKLTAVAAVLGTALAAANIFEYFLPALIFLGIVIAPVAGVYVVDFAFDADRYRQGMPSEGLRPAPFVAWIIGSGVGIMTLPASSYGLGFLTLTSIPTVDAILCAALVHTIFCGFLKPRFYRSQAS